MTLRLGRGSPWGLGQGSKGVSVFFRPPSSSGACKASLSSFGILSPFYRRVCLFVPLPLFPRYRRPIHTSFCVFSHRGQRPRPQSNTARSSLSPPRPNYFPIFHRSTIFLSFSLSFSTDRFESIDIREMENRRGASNEMREGKGEFFLS